MVALVKKLESPCPTGSTGCLLALTVKGGPESPKPFNHGSAMDLTPKLLGMESWPGLHLQPAALAPKAPLPPGLPDSPPLFPG